MEIIRHPLVEIALRTAVVYFVILVGLRLTGKREVGQMMPLDLTMLILLANAVQNAMTGPDTSLLGGVVTAATLLVMNVMLTRVAWRYRKIRRLVEGTPTLLIRHGKVLHENLAKEKLNIDDLQQALREHGIASVAEVTLAVLEIDCAVSVLKNDDLPAISRPHHHVQFFDRK
ncbi:MAG: DUF421 domain-containing protein [candidate division KSB1 bacterium]|nr:DUF421 domain-containing protein [candidate division KSB1 bacterium]MDZ7311310.1 DUF421 domain-containing protein [candidate division KSB1 bacterium]